jgi:hypothetical protein
MNFIVTDTLGRNGEGDLLVFGRDGPPECDKGLGGRARVLDIG